MWEWLQGLSGGAASFVGSVAGSSIGLIALLIGALFNAHLNRRRDDRVRRDDVRALAAALHSELDGMRRTLEENAVGLKKVKDDFIVPDLAHSIRILPEVLGKVGLLDVQTIRHVMDAYIIIEQYCGHLTMRGGIVSTQAPNRRLIGMKMEKAATVVSLNEIMAVEIQKALADLRKYFH